MTQPINQVIEKNERRQCKAQGCTENRSRIGGFCRKHDMQNYRFGHPLHRRLNRRDYLGHLEEVQYIINKNASHEGILLAIDFLDTMLNSALMDAVGSYPKDSRKYLCRLYDHGVRPVDILSECAALVLLQYREPNRIMSRRHLVTLIGLRLCYMVPGLRAEMKLGCTVPGRICRAIGEFIMKDLGVLLVSIQRACEKAIEKEHAIKRALSSELEV